MNHIIVRYSEIALKGHNRPKFEKQLVTNIVSKLKLNPSQISRQAGQLVIQADRATPWQQLNQVFGISWFAPALCVPQDYQSIKEASLTLSQSIIPNHTFAVRAHRSSKSIPFKSQDLQVKIGALIAQATQARVNLSNPDFTLNIHSIEDQTFVFLKRFSGPGGLPVGISGRVLCLLSGGFDSIASAYLLAKRGARVDFLHFHVFPDVGHLSTTKIPEIASALKQFTGESRLFAASYLPFQFKVLNLPETLSKYELVTFRRLMARVGERLALVYGHQALIFGDNLGQVASQTLENMASVSQAVSLPIFRPVIGADKDQTISLVRQIGLESLAVAPYKDCCSLIASHPATKANAAKITQLENYLNQDQLVEEIFSHIQEMKNPGQVQPGL